MYFNVNSMRHMSHFFLPLVYRIHHSVGYALHTPEHDMAHWWRGGGQRSTKYDAGTRIAVQIQTKGENYREKVLQGLVQDSTIKLTFVSILTIKNE